MSSSSQVHVVCCGMAVVVCCVVAGVISLQVLHNLVLSCVIFGIALIFLIFSIFTSLGQYWFGEDFRSITPDNSYQSSSDTISVAVSSAVL